MQPDLKQAVEEHSAGYADPVTFYVEKLTEGVATLGAAFWPKPVIVRLSDFKSNEYSSLTGGTQYEPHEENPDARFPRRLALYRRSFRECFELECRALKKVRDEMGLTNVEIMVPFVRTVAEAAGVIDLLAAERPEARRERAAHHHDVRDSVQCGAGGPVPASISTVFRSARTT